MIARWPGRRISWFVRTAGKSLVLPPWFASPASRYDDVEMREWQLVHDNSSYRLLF